MSQVGDIIGQRYLLTGELGQGAMSEVFSALDQKLNRQVAIKMLLPHLAKQPEAVERFQREASAVAKLDDHPNIVRIYDYSGPDVTPAYLAMELIQGSTLAKFMADHHNDWPDLGALIVLPLAKALAYAHQHQIIHRDIKPENVMISHDGQIKLVDFGIARAADTSTITATGALMGSPAYMAPEYLNGAPPGHLADVYSLGILLYHLTTGHLPFEAPTPAALFKKVCSGEFNPPELIEQRLSPSLAKIIRKSMDLAPLNRFTSAEKMAIQLENAVQNLRLGNPNEALAAYLTNPEEFTAAHLNAWLKENATLAQTNVSQGNITAALAYYQQLLAFEPQNENYLTQVKRLRKKHNFKPVLKRILAACTVFALFFGIVFSLEYWLPLFISPTTKTPPPLEEALPLVRPVYNTPKNSPDDIEPEKPLPDKEEVAQAVPTTAVHANTKKSTMDQKQAPRIYDNHSAKDNVIKNATVPVTFHAFPYANIWIDGQLRAQNAMSPIQFQLTPGKHTVKYIHPAAQPKEEHYQILPNDKNQSFREHLEPLPAKLILNLPESSTVSIGEDLLVVSPLSKTEGHIIELSDKQFSHSYKVTVTEPDGNTWQKTILLRAGQATTLER